MLLRIIYMTVVVVCAIPHSNFCIYNLISTVLQPLGDCSQKHLKIHWRS